MLGKENTDLCKKSWPVDLTTSLRLCFVANLMPFEMISSEVALMA